MPTPTGPGQVHIFKGDVDDPLFMTRPFESALLENYDIDGDELKTEHQSFLDKSLIKFLKSNSSFKLKLEGYASKSGDMQYNQKLSEQRIKKLIIYLVKKGIPQSRMPFELIQAYGELKSKAKSDESPKDRSIRITLVVNWRPPPPPPRQRSTPGKPVPGWIPIPPKFKDTLTIPVQEIYLKFDFIESSDGKPEKSSRRWRRLDEKTTWGYVDINHSASVMGRPLWRDFVKFKDSSGGKWVTGARLSVQSIIANYTYKPSATPSSGPGFVIPLYAEDVIALYSKGSDCDPPKDGPV